MDPPERNSEPAEFDETLLGLDSGSFLNAWVEHLLVDGGDTAREDDRPFTMPPENMFSNMDGFFEDSESALVTNLGMTRGTESTSHITAYDYLTGPLVYFHVPQDSVPGLDPFVTNLTDARHSSFPNQAFCSSFILWTFISVLEALITPPAMLSCKIFPCRASRTQETCKRQRQISAAVRHFRCKIPWPVSPFSFKASSRLHALVSAHQAQLLTFDQYSPLRAITLRPKHTIAVLPMTSDTLKLNISIL